MKVTQAQISQNCSVAHQKNQLLETKLKESQETNSKLDSELQVASLQIVCVIDFTFSCKLFQMERFFQVDLELKLRAAEKVISNEKQANK